MADSSQVPFSDDVYRRSSPDFTGYLRQFEHSERRFYGAEFEIRWQPGMADPRWQFDNHVDLLRGAYTAKARALTRLVTESVNQEAFLAYGLAGRSLIEHAATMRYYVHRIAQKVEGCVQKGTVTLAELRDLFNEIDRNLRGSRFDWTGFSKGHMSNTEFQVAEGARQVNVNTCIQNWVKQEPNIQVLYDMFCDLVHPNIGSTFLVMRLWDGPSLGFSSASTGDAVGWQVFVQTFPGLIPVLREVMTGLEVLDALKFGDEAR